MWGWLSAAIARASLSKRSAWGLVSCLMATMRPSRVSRAFHTSPIPPAPMGERISYGPRRVPDCNVTDQGVGPRALVYRYEPLQLLEPVLHNDNLRLRADAGFRLATADDQEPSIGGDVVRPSPTAPRERGE